MLGADEPGDNSATLLSCAIFPAAIVSEEHSPHRITSTLSMVISF
jgi:hypothetical protein